MRSRSEKYLTGVTVIALNDNTGNGDSVEEIASYISTGVVASMWDFTDEEVAADIAKIRRQNGLEVADEPRVW